MLVSPCGSLMSAHQAGSRWDPSSSSRVDSEEGCQSPSEGPLLYLLHTVHTSRRSVSVNRLCANNASLATELVRALTKGSEHQSDKTIWVLYSAQTGYSVLSWVSRCSVRQFLKRVEVSGHLLPGSSAGSGRQVYSYPKSEMVSVGAERSLVVEATLITAPYKALVS